MRLKLWLLAISVATNLHAIPYAQISTDLANKITYMIKSTLPDATVGVTVQDVDSGKILYEYHGAKNFTPASTAKLFTAAAALKELGPDYRYDTALFYDKISVKDHVLNGDVAVKFSGDPSLQLANIHGLLKKLHAVKVQTIKGDLILDDTVFEGPLIGHGWTWDSTPWYYSAPVAAIIIGYNQLGVTLFPCAEIGGKVGAALDPMHPATRFTALKSDLRAVTFEDSETICQINAVVDEQNNVELGGCWPLGTQPVHLKLAVKNPRLLAQKLILEALRNLNIKFSGKVKFNKVPDNLVKLAHHESEPLSVLLNAILADSDNLYAESLTKTLGAKLYGVGSFKTGALAVKNVLSNVTGIDFNQTRMLDGSGESRYNLITPLQLTRLLYTMQHEPKLGPHFRNALALSGVNGTLQKRFASFDTKANINAKTGTLTGVSTLAGYFKTRSHHNLIVTIMINHALDSNAMLKQFENELCYFLMNQL